MANPSRTLGERIPERGLADADADEALDVLLGWVADQGLTLYPAQEEAILELYADKHVILETPTGSGKSLVATALHFQELAEGASAACTPRRSRRW
jgi:superfamily II RNA helicase